MATRPSKHLPARAWRGLRWAARRGTSRWRKLPDFIIIGAPRAGTTSLYQAMCRHPDIAQSFRKEVHYFDGRTSRGPGWYRSSFPLRRSHRLAGEATPNYFAYPDAPQKARQLVPEARLIALLRDPVERAHSAWRLKVYQGVEDRSFSDAIRHEADHPMTATDRLDRAALAAAGPVRHAYLEKSRYVEHVERWLTVYPREQLLLIRSGDLFRAPERHLAEIFDFVGVDPAKGTQLPHKHAAPPADIDRADREWLEAYFKPYNRKLADLTGINLD